MQQRVVSQFAQPADTPPTTTRLDPAGYVAAPPRTSPRTSPQPQPQPDVQAVAAKWRYATDAKGRVYVYVASKTARRPPNYATGLFSF